MTRPVIELRDVWRRYRLAGPAARQTLRGSLAHGRRGLRSEWRWALRGVDLAVERGRALAVVGANGAGKSTLLRLMGGIGRPDRGTVRVDGRIGALLDLGRELHPDLTGRQNAELAAVVAGLTRAEFARRSGDIVEFAGLASFIDQPLHAYSDGMRARLAFSVAAHLDPEVLLVDEVLAVGDAAFQRRSLERIEHLRHRGATVVFVSHDLSLVRRACDDAAWLDEGVVRAVGPVEEVVAAYLGGPSLDEAPRGGVLGSVAVLDAWGVPAASIRTGDGLVVRLAVEPPPGEGPVQASVQLARAGAPALAVDTSTECAAGRSLEVRFERLDLAPGRYEVVVGAFSHGWRRRLDEQRLDLEVTGEGATSAALAPPHEWRILP